MVIPPPAAPAAPAAAGRSIATFLSGPDLFPAPAPPWLIKPSSPLAGHSALIAEAAAAADSSFGMT